MLGVQRVLDKFRSPGMIKDLFGNWKHQAVDILAMISLCSVYSRRAYAREGGGYYW